jgi:hypothetical protein
MLDRTANPRRHRPVISIRRPANLGQQLRGNRTGTGVLNRVRRRLVPAAPGSPPGSNRRTPHLVSSGYSSIPPILSGEARSSLIAADRPATARIAVTSGSQRHHQHSPSDLGTHQPVRRRLGRVEQRIIGPYVIHVLKIAGTQPAVSRPHRTRTHSQTDPAKARRSESDWVKPVRRSRRGDSNP